MLLVTGDAAASEAVLLGLVPEGAEGAELWWYPLADVRGDGLAPALVDGPGGYDETLRRLVRFRLRPDAVVAGVERAAADGAARRGEERLRAGLRLRLEREPWQAATRLRVTGAAGAPAAGRPGADAVVLRGHVAGNGSIAGLTRLLAIALDGAVGGERAVLLEDLVGKPLAANRTMTPVQRADLERILARPDPPGARIVASVRCTYRLPEERLLRSGAFDWPERPLGEQLVWAGVAYSEVDADAEGVRDMVACFDRWLAVSTHSRDALVAGGVPAARIDLLPHPVDDRVFFPGARPAAESAFTVLNVSVGFPRLKGLDVLVKAFASAFRGDRSARLRIHQRKGGLEALAAGDAAVARALGELGDRVLVTSGPVAQHELAELYRGAGCYVQPSRAEASGLTALEAACCGTPALVTGWGGPLDYADGVAVVPIAHRLAEAEPAPLAWGSRGLWAEPSVEHLAELLAGVRRDASARREASEAAAPGLASRFGLAATGRRAEELLFRAP